MAGKSDRTLMVRFEGEVDKSVENSARKVEGELDQTGKRAVETSKKHQNVMIGLAAGVGAAAGQMAAKGLGMIADFVVDSAKQAITQAGNLEQSIGAIDAVFKDSAAQMHEWSKSAANDVGLTRNEFNELGTLIGMQLRNGGTAMDELGPKTRELISLGADMSSMFGGTSKEAVEALSSALKGERDPIEKYRVTLNQAMIDAEAAALGFKKVGGSLSTQAQQAATLSLIMKQTSVAHGNFAKEADTFAGKQQRFAAGWENFATSLGMLVLPALTDTLGLLNDGLPYLDAFAVGLEAIGTILFSGDYTGALADAFGWEEDSDVVGFLFGVRDAFIQIDQFLKGAGSILIDGDFTGGVMGVEEDSPVVAGLFAIRDGLGALGESFGRARDVIVPIALQVWDWLTVKWGEIAPAVEGIFGSILAIVGEVMGIIGAEIEIYMGIIGWLWDAAGDDWLRIVGGIWDLVIGVFGGAFKIIEGILGVFSGILTGDTDKMMDGVHKIIDGGFQALEGLFRGALGILGGIWGGIKSVFAAPVDWVITNVFNPLMAGIEKVAGVFGMKLALPRLSTIGGGSSSSSGSPQGAMRAFAGGGYTGDGGVWEPAGIVHRGEVVWSQADIKAWGGLGAVEAMRTMRLPGYAGGGIVANASQGFKGYDPRALAAMQAWAAATGRMWTMTGNGGARSFADQKRAWDLYQAGKGPLAANPWRGGPHMYPAIAMDLSPRPGEIPSARAMLARFGLGLTVPGEPWHVQALAGRSGGTTTDGAGGFDPMGMLLGAIGSIAKVKDAGVFGDVLNAMPGVLLKGAGDWLLGGGKKYDAGGWLQPGHTLAVNATGQPEAILTAGQWDVLRTAASGRDLARVEQLLEQLIDVLGDAVLGNLTVQIEDSQLRELLEDLVRSRRRQARVGVA